MVGAVIENLSNRKLFYILSTLFAVQIGFFLVGSWYAPVPTSSMDFIFTKCTDKTRNNTKKWFHLRPPQCDVIEDLSEYVPERQIDQSFDLREIVFVAQMPHMRDGVELEYSPWFQFLLGIIQIDIEYHSAFRYEDNAKIKLEVRMGYRTRGDEPTNWHDFINTEVTRTMECTVDKKQDGRPYNCEPLDLFELGSSAYPFYLMNIRIPIDQRACERDPKLPNCQIGYLRDLRMIVIHQNGGFTLVWLWLKTIVTPFVVVAVMWYWRRVQMLPRKPMLLEKSIMALGTSMAILDFPIEWASLAMRLPFSLLLNDIRQGLFYAVLFSFWLIFAGEHLIDDTSRNNIWSYWRNLSLVCTASLALLLYDICERGMQLNNPFYSIWSSSVGSSIAYWSIYIAMVCTLSYFVFLLYKIWMVWTSIKRKRSAQLYQTNEHRRVKVEAIIYRFKFLMLFTLLCAGLTIASYIMKQYGEAQMHDDEPMVSMLHNATSAFFTGTFGMWNIYVVLLLAMYAPSHKLYSGAQLIDETEVLMDGSTTEANPLTTFLKPATD